MQNGSNPESAIPSSSFNLAQTENIFQLEDRPQKTRRGQNSNFSYWFPSFKIVIREIFRVFDNFLVLSRLDLVNNRRETINKFEAEFPLQSFDGNFKMKPTQKTGTKSPT